MKRTFGYVFALVMYVIVSIIVAKKVLPEYGQAVFWGGMGGVVFWAIVERVALAVRMKNFIILPIVTLLLAGCASGVRPAFDFRVERYSYGERTPYDAKVPKQEWRVSGPGFCSPCGSGVRSNGTGSVSGWDFGPDGYPRRVQRTIR